VATTTAASSGTVAAAVINDVVAIAIAIPRSRTWPGAHRHGSQWVGNHIAATSASVAAGGGGDATRALAPSLQ